MRVHFVTVELLTIYAALPHAASLYDAMALKEVHPLDRKNVEGYAAAARGLLARFTLETDPELSPGDVAVLERALRFETSRWQQMIKPSMAPAEKEALREAANEVAQVIVKLRQARGLDS